jgi:hypothetical protein
MLWHTGIQATYDSESLMKQKYFSLQFCWKTESVICPWFYSSYKTNLQYALKYERCLFFHVSLYIGIWWQTISWSATPITGYIRIAQSLHSSTIICSLSSWFEFKMSMFDICSVLLPSGLECLQRDTPCFLGAPQSELPPSATCV